MQVTTFLLSLGFVEGGARITVQLYASEARLLYPLDTVHGDDFLKLLIPQRSDENGAAIALDSDEAMKNRYELKMEVLGPNAGQTEWKYEFSLRIIRWTEETGLEYEPDQRHADQDHF